jgi:hypothetical protein
MFKIGILLGYFCSDIQPGGLGSHRVAADCTKSDSASAELMLKGILEQRGIAGAADKVGALVRCDEPVGAFQEEFLAESFAGDRGLEHQ